DHGDGHILHVAQTLERAHDAPHRAEQAHVGADRTDVGEEFQVALQRADLAGTGHLHRALGTFDHAALVVGLALALAGEFAEARLEDVLHAVAGAAVAHFAEQLGQVAAGPETLLEGLRVLQRRLGLAVLADDDDPGHEGEHQQDQQHALHGQAGARDQLENVQSAVHCLGVLRFGWVVRGAGSRIRSAGIATARMRRVSTQATRTLARTRQAPSARSIVWPNRILAARRSLTATVTDSSSSSRAARRKSSCISRTRKASPVLSLNAIWPMPSARSH